MNWDVRKKLIKANPIANRVRYHSSTSARKGLGGHPAALDNRQSAEAIVDPDADGCVGVNQGGKDQPIGVIEQCQSSFFGRVTSTVARSGRLGARASGRARLRCKR